jgi:hypothetical protein
MRKGKIKSLSPRRNRSKCSCFFQVFLRFLKQLIVFNWLDICCYNRSFEHEAFFQSTVSLVLVSKFLNNRFSSIFSLTSVFVYDVRSNSCLANLGWEDQFRSPHLSIHPTDSNLVAGLVTNLKLLHS